MAKAENEHVPRYIRKQQARAYWIRAKKAGFSAAKDPICVTCWAERQNGAALRDIKVREHSDAPCVEKSTDPAKSSKVIDLSSEIMEELQRGP